MGLKPTYTDDVKVTNTGLCVRYNVSLVEGSWYRVSRTATKSYAYVGLTRAAANACAEAKRQKYWRDHVSVDGSATLQRFSSCQANIVSRRDSGESWVCEIDVDEYDERYSLTEPTNVVQMFEEENKRDYDETPFLKLVNYDRTEEKLYFMSYFDTSIDEFARMLIDGQNYGVVTSTCGSLSWVKWTNDPPAPGSVFKLEWPRTNPTVFSNEVTAP